MKYASPDQGKENDMHLSAKEKAQVFQNALYSRNMTGEIDPRTQQIVYPQLNYGGRTNLAARLFFEKNPAIPVSVLLEVVDACLEQKIIHAGSQDRPEGLLRYVLEVSDVTKFLINLDQILSCLSSEYSPPLINFIKWDEVFEKRKKQAG